MDRIGPSYDPPHGGASVQSVLRALRDTGFGATAQGIPLEVRSNADEPPRLETATPIEGTSVSVRTLTEPPAVGFVAFLDGIQRSHVRAHHVGVPVVHGAIAAAVRIRESRKLRTWEAPIRSHACYLPQAAIDPALWNALAARCPVVNSLAPLESDTPVPRHPSDLLARALTAVQRDRERAETSLAESWTLRGSGPLLIDGGISGSEAVARSALVAGAVKSHRTLYVAGESLEVILGLREGERTTAVVVSSPRRTPVASWYLRLRAPAGRGPLFGLVRVEVAHSAPDTITARADLVSRWLLAERAPVALPDARWDVMVYGIRECEEYLSAILR
jgi:hypothetical protein